MHFDYYNASTGIGHSYSRPLSGWREYTTDWIVSPEGSNLATWGAGSLKFTYCEGSADNAT
jgi:hypothetical protein